ncbi:MAG: glutathione peroxidase [Phycisphaerales bacterium]
MTMTKSSTKTIITLAAGSIALLALSACSGNGEADGSSATGSSATGSSATGSSESQQESAMTQSDASTPSTPSTPNVRGASFQMADGTPASMDDYQGRVVLVVNVASRCGLTPQVADLQSLQQAYAGRPFTVLAFPSASFNQEPLASADAAAFCEDMGATYPVAAKVEVTGDAAHPLFATLSEQGGQPSWNFTKYLVAKDGTVVARFDPRTSPTADEVKAAIDAAL